MRVIPSGCARCGEPLAAYAPVGARAHEVCAEPEGAFLDAAGRIIPELVAVEGAGVTSAPSRPVGPGRSHAPQGDLRTLLAAALAANEARPSRIVSIPGVVRWLAEKASPAVSLADVHAALLAAVERRELDLRAVEPSALTRRGDAELCPPGPNGKVLAYGRRLVIPTEPRCSLCGRVAFAPIHDENAIGADAHAFEAAAERGRP